MKSFYDWIQTEAKFPKEEYKTMAAKAIIKELGGDPTQKIDVTDLVTVGDQIKPAHELESALEKGIEFAKAQGARASTVGNIKLALEKNRGDQMKLMQYILNLINAALTRIEKIEREKGKESWEKQRKSPRRQEKRD